MDIGKKARRRKICFEGCISLKLAITLFVVVDLTKALHALKQEGENELDYQFTNENCLEEKKSPVCFTPGCIHAASSVLKSMDESVNPCDDFYQFACGGYLQKTIIPDDKSSVISFYDIGDRVKEQMRATLEEPPKSNEPRPFALLKSTYNACMNMTAIEEHGLQTIKSIFKQLGGWPVLEGSHWKEDKFDWKTTIYKFRKIGLPTSSFFWTGIEVDSKNSSKRIIGIDEASLGLTREYLVEGFENDIVNAYYDYLVDLAVIFGADRSIALKELKDAVDFEINLSKIRLPKEQRRNMSALYNPMTVSELQEKFPSISWVEYINNVLDVPSISISTDEVVEMNVPKFISDLEILLNQTEKRVQANYAMYRVVNLLASFLTKEIRNRQLKFKERAAGVTAMQPRWKECVDVAVGSMKIAAGALYVRKYFHEGAKKNAKILVANLQTEFQNILKEVDWMDETTKNKALEKATAMDLNIAYPQELMDDKKIEKYYSKLDSTSNNYLELALSVGKFNFYLTYEKLREVVNKTDWVDHSAVTRVNAGYAMTENSIHLPAGILQEPFFDHERPHYMNYGAMGFVIGHEITHGFDDMGRQFNKDGEVEEWWAEETRESFMEKAQCIIEQYGNYTVTEINLKLNGINTQGENIADNGGIKEAYLAYQTWVERNGEEPGLPGLNYTPNQLFWISSANLWCSKQRNEFLKLQVANDNHSPTYFRVLGAFSNSEYFSKDFDCPVGSKMNPKDKCRVW